VRRHDRKEVANYLDRIKSYVLRFAKHELPASRTMLEQVATNLTNVISVFDRVRSTRAKVDGNDIEQLHVIYSDLKNKVDATESGNGDVLVPVRTFDGRHKETNGFLACYSYGSDAVAERCVKSFPSLSSPTSFPLPVATYTFWAADRGNHKRVSMQRQNIPVTRPQAGTYPPVDLTITP
jgi:hypothetical protein